MVCRILVFVLCLYNAMKLDWRINFSVLVKILMVILAST